MNAVHLLNTAIIPAFPGSFRVYGGSYTVEQARAALTPKGCGIGEDYDGPEVNVVSHIGHQSTADMMSTMLGRPVEMSRAPWDGTGFAIVCQLSFRGEEGRIYSAVEMSEFEARGLMTWRWMEIIRG